MLEIGKIPTKESYEEVSTCKCGRQAKVNASSQTFPAIKSPTLSNPNVPRCNRQLAPTRDPQRITSYLAYIHTTSPSCNSANNTN